LGPTLWKLATKPRNPEKATVDWIFVYIAEAHAIDEWPVWSGRFNRGRGAVRVAHQPQTSIERCTLARKFMSDFDMTMNDNNSNVQFLVDDCDRQDPFEQMYAPWPVRLYLIGEDGVLQWFSSPKDCSHDEDVTTLIAMLGLDP
jgi:hypothetical protein